MSRTIEAVFDQGVFRPRETVRLPQGQVVRVLLPEGPQGPVEPVVEGTHNARAQLLALAGLVDSGDRDAANNQRIDADLAQEYGAAHEEE